MTGLKIKRYPNGKWKQNCYVVSGGDERSLIIDPGSEFEGIMTLLSQSSLKPVAILNTHAHYDHIGAITELQSYYQIPFFLHAEDANLLKRANVYKLLFESKSNIVIPKFDRAYPDSCAGSWNYSGFMISVIYTPGHTKGSVCLLIDGALFSGDTLLPNGPGRSDLPGGDRQALISSLEKLRTLPEETMVYPGHGRPFSLQSFYQHYYES